MKPSARVVALEGCNASKVGVVVVTLAYMCGENTKELIPALL